MGRKGDRNRRLRKQNIPEVIQFCDDHEFNYEWMAGDWQLRIEEVIDIYPTRKRFFWLPTKEWGWYKDYDDLGKIMSERTSNGNN